MVAFCGVWEELSQLILWWEESSANRIKAHGKIREKKGMERVATIRKREDNLSALSTYNDLIPDVITALVTA